MTRIQDRVAEPALFYRPGVPLRPQRISLKVPVRYHILGDDWYQGWTENISRTGVLIRAAAPAPLGAEIDVVLTVPAGVLSELAGEIICAGAVARVVPGADGGPDAFAVVFRSWRRTVGRRSF